MTHDEARELIGAVPDETSPELLAHLQTCPECEAFRADMLVFNAKLRRALELDWQKVQGAAPPAGPIPKPAPTANRRDAAPGAKGATVTVLQKKERAPVAKHKSPRLFAFAASIAAALVVGTTLWLSRPPASLAAEIVTHVEGEPNSWQ